MDFGLTLPPGAGRDLQRDAHCADPLTLLTLAGAVTHRIGLGTSWLPSAPGEVDQLAGDLEKHLAQPDTVTIHWLLCQAWARKPTVD